jgi:hypothetical protein
MAVDLNNCATFGKIFEDIEPIVDQGNNSLWTHNSIL